MKTIYSSVSLVFLFYSYSCSGGSQFIVQQDISGFEYIRLVDDDNLIKIDYKILGHEHQYIILSAISEENEYVEILYYDGDINLVEGSKDATILWNPKFEKLPKGIWYIHLSTSDTVT